MNLMDIIRAIKPHMVCRPVAIAPTVTGIQIDWDNALVPPVTGAATAVHEHSEPSNGLIDGKADGGRVDFQIRVAARDTEANGHDLKWAPALRNKGETTWYYPLDNMSSSITTKRTISAVGATVLYDMVSGVIPTVEGFNDTNFELGIWCEEQTAETEDQELALVNSTIIEADYIPSR